MKLFKYILLLLFTIYFTSCNSQNYRSSDTITIENFKKEIINNNAQIIDVRTAYEFNKGAIKNAQNISILDFQFEEKVNQLNKDVPVYVYCHSGVRSAKACKKLKKLGFKFVYDYSGGYKEWIELEK